MTALRSPLRSALRGPLRGGLESRFGGAVSIINRINDGNTFSAWTNSNVSSVLQNATDPDGNANSAWTLTDSSGTQAGYLEKAFNETLVNTEIYTVAFDVKKQAVVSPTPIIRIDFTGGTANSFQVQLNLVTGAANQQVTTAANRSVSLVSNGTFWRVTMTASDASANNLVGAVRIYPAGNGSYPLGGINAAITGSNVFYNVLVTRP